MTQEISVPSLEDQGQYPPTLFVRFCVLLFSILGMISLSCAVHLNKSSDAEDVSILFVLLSPVLLGFFIVSMSRFYELETRLYERGMFSLVVSMVIILGEIIMRFSGGANALTIIILDFINGYVFIKARRILVPMASEIIQRYGDNSRGRQGFGFMITLFGVLFTALQIMTLFLIFSSDLKYNWFLIVFCGFQVFSAYWGYILTRLGIAIQAGYEPEFAARERVKIETFKQKMRNRKSIVISLLKKKPDEQEQIRRAAFDECSAYGARVVRVKFDFDFLVYAVFGVPAFLGGLALADNKQYLWSGLLLGVSVLLGWRGFTVLRNMLRMRRKNYTVFSEAGMQVFSTLSRSPEEEPAETKVLWVELSKVRGLRRFNVESGRIILSGYQSGFQIEFTGKSYPIDKVSKSIRKYMDEPLILEDFSEVIEEDELCNLLTLSETF